MATSILEIANLALARLGEMEVANLGPILTPGASPFGQQTALEKSAQIQIPLCLAAELRRHRWNFALRESALTLAAVTGGEWTARAPLPAGFLRLAAVLDDSGSEAWPWEIREGHVYLKEADSAELKLRYVAYEADTSKWDAMFSEAFVCRLAARLAETLRGSTSASQQLEAEANRLFSEARRCDANEGKRRLGCEQRKAEIEYN